MSKKIRGMLALSVSLIAQTSQIQAATNPNGLMFGVHGGFGTGHATTKIFGIAAGSIYTEAFDLRQHSTAGGLHLSYQHQVQAFLLGLGIYADLCQNKGTFFAFDKGGNETRLRRLKRDKYYGAEIRVGCHPLDQVAFYGKYALEEGRFKYTQNSQILTEITSFAKSKRRYAHVLGGGIQIFCTQHWVVGLEYTFAFYRKLKYIVPDLTSDGTNLDVTTRVKPRIGTTMLHVSYKF